VTRSQITPGGTEADQRHNVRQHGFATRAIHHAYDPADHHGAVAPPVYFTSTYAFPSVAENEEAAALGGVLYAREYNPTTAILEVRLASLEGAEACLAVPLGLVLSELVTNCIKYAVKDRPDGFVSTSFRVDAGTPTRRCWWSGTTARAWRSGGREASGSDWCGPSPGSSVGASMWTARLWGPR